MGRSLTTLVIGVAGVVVGAAAVVTYFSFIARPATNRCLQSKHHCVQVTVDPNSGVLRVDNDRLVKKTEPGHVITWIILNGPGQSFSFPTTPVPGIAFMSSDHGTDEFACSIDPTDSNKFECTDKTGPGLPMMGEFKYTVTVTGGPGNPAPLDPRVIND